ncbi:hypothetical protein D3C87_2002200 [compost metagenome]
MFYLAGIGLAFKHESPDAARLGLGESAGSRLVGDNRDDLGRKTRFRAGIGQRHHIGAAARDEDDDALFGRVHDLILKTLRNYRPSVPL